MRMIEQAGIEPMRWFGAPLGSRSRIQRPLDALQGRTKMRDMRLGVVIWHHAVQIVAHERKSRSANDLRVNRPKRTLL